MMKQTILVTGGAGFIGSALCKSLLLIGYQVVCIDNFDAFYSPEIKQKNIDPLFENKKFNFEKGDIRDVDFLEMVFKKFNINVVVHLAGKGGVRYSIENILDYFDVNVTGSINLLEVMKRFNVKNFIFASSSSIYGDNTKVLKETDCSNRQLSPYATSKKTIELVNYNYHQNHYFNIINLRLFSIYGNNQRPDLLIPKIFDAVKNGKEIEIYGDGLQMRDFTHINDVLTAFHQSIKLLNESSGSIYEIFNIGNHQPISINKLVELIEKELKTTIKRSYVSKQIGDTQSTFADITKAKTILNYAPTINISAGIKAYSIWYKNNRNDRNT